MACVFKSMHASTGDPAEKTISGTVSTFNFVDRHGDTVVRGAYKDSVAKNYKDDSELKPGGLMVGMYFDHETLIGGIVKLVENNDGLDFTGRITDGVTSGEDAYKHYKAGVIHSASIGGLHTSSGVIVNVNEEDSIVIKNLSKFMTADEAKSVMDSARKNWIAKNYGLRLITSVDVIDVTITNMPANESALLKNARYSLIEKSKKEDQTLETLKSFLDSWR